LTHTVSRPGEGASTAPAATSMPARYDRYATTQPVSPAREQTGTWAKLPPVVAPVATSTCPPIGSASSSRSRIAGSASKKRWRMRLTISAPCEWPTSTIFRPPLNAPM